VFSADEAGTSVFCSITLTKSSTSRFGVSAATATPDAAPRVASGTATVAVSTTDPEGRRRPQRRIDSATCARSWHQLGTVKQPPRSTNPDPDRSRPCGGVPPAWAAHSDGNA